MLRTAVGGHYVDKGGQWIGENHHRMLHLLDELNIQKNESYINGKCFYFWNGSTKESPFMPDFRNSHLFMDPRLIHSGMTLQVWITINFLKCQL